MAILNDLGKIERDCRAARAARNDNGTIAIASILALTKKFPKIVLVFIVSAFVWGSLHAIMIKLPLSKLATESEAIVLADVLQVKCEWSWDRQLILSVVSLQVGEVLKGKLDQPEILIQVPGGTVGDIELRVSDMPDFTAGERVLVFLSEIPDRIGNRNSPSLSLFSTPAFQVFGFEDNTHPPLSQYSLDPVPACDQAAFGQRFGRLGQGFGEGKRRLPL